MNKLISSRFCDLPKEGVSIMPTVKQNYPVFKLRIALTTSDYERLVKFYCDGLGIALAAICSAARCASFYLVCEKLGSSFEKNLIV